MYVRASRKIIGSLMLSLSFAAAAAGTEADARSDAQRALAVVSGRVQTPGLHHAVRVLRDRWGVAHIYAQDSHDLFFAQGLVAAQDRLFQMELWKRAGQGRLSEVLGPQALARDVNARALQYRGDMRREYSSYSPDTQAILTAFTDGINAYIRTLTATGGPGLPVEFRLAGFAPEDWHPEDCLNRMAAFSMTGNAFSELEHAQALAELGTGMAAKVLEFDPPVALDPAPGVDLHGLTPDLLKNLVGSDRRIEFAANATEGSNNWTIAGALTQSGKPVLANDPHRVIALPSLRYMVHLVAPGWNVIGAGEPGLPGVALGHNEHIAWGFTIFGLDQQDLYVEELNPSNPLQYRTESGWRAMQTRREVFKIKGAASREILLKSTGHGPVLWSDGHRALALRWVGSEPGTAGYLASLAIDRVQNWKQFEAAVGRWKVPSENLVYADTAGNIGEHSAGLAPRRSWTGLLPVSGAGNHAWTGFVPTAELPHAFNPASGFIATANQKMIPDRYPHRIGFEWDPGYRAARVSAEIGRARDEGRKLTLADMESLQADDLSLPALQFQQLLRTTSLAADASLDGFLRWDGRLGRESADAVLYEVWFRELGKALAPRISKQHRDRYADLSPKTLLRLLAHPDRDLFGENPAAERDRMLGAALLSARGELEGLMGRDPAGWSWGRLHTMSFRHALDREPGAAEWLDIPPMARPGDGFTVNATAVDRHSWAQVAGASYREILDTGDWDRSLAVNTPGQSGQPGSPHYADLAPLWDAGQYFPLAYSRQAVEAASTDRLVLEP